MPYGIDPKYKDRQAWANSVDQDQIQQNIASDQGLHCLLLTQQFLDMYVIFLSHKVLTFFLFLHNNICFGYSFKAPRQVTTNEHAQRL